MRNPSSKPGRKGSAAPPDAGAPGPDPASPEDETPAPNAAFDIWLERGLHTLFDTIAQEPIPDALLNIIEESRKKR